MYVLSKKHKSVSISVLYLECYVALPWQILPVSSPLQVYSKVVVIGKLLLQSYIV